MYKRHKKSVIGGIALALVLIFITGALGAVTKGFRNWNPSEWVDEIKDKIKTSDSESEKPVDGEGNVLEDGQALPSNILFRSYNLGTEAETGLTLTATITPSNATNQSLNWSVSWGDNLSAEQTNWKENIEAKGKTAANYVSISPLPGASTTGNTMTVTCLEDFGAKIKITVTSEDNSSASASCVCDYLKNIKTVDFKIALTPSGLEIDESAGGQGLLTSSNQRGKLTYTPVYTNYTVDRKFTDVLSLKGSNDVYTALKNAGLSVTAPACQVIGEAAGFTEITDLPITDLGIFELYNLSTTADQRSAGAVVHNNCPTSVLFTLDALFSYDYETIYTATVEFVLSPSAFNISVSSVSLDKTTISF